uniref:Uncharacterized protein n=1 Tax=Arundo donax TaxID=35708 RepID=A0A0A9EXJ0_ARUDO
MKGAMPKCPFIEMRDRIYFSTTYSFFTVDSLDVCHCMYLGTPSVQNIRGFSP